MERIGELVGRRKAIGGDLLQRALNRRIDVRRDRVPERSKRPRRLCQQPRDDRLRRRAVVRRFSAQHFVRHRGKRVDVRAAVDAAISGRLLRGHVVRRA